MKLSIIVPVYNVGPYIERCLLSLLNQDIPPEEYEIIVVNDGSPDDSRDYVVKLQQEAVNITLIDQENKGVSAARNTGIGRSSGKFILAIDPDDYVCEQSLNIYIQQAEQEDLDVLYLGFEVYDIFGNNLGKNGYEHLENKILTGVETYHFTRGKGFKIPDRSVGILYKKSFLNTYSLLYTPAIPFLEDGLFVGQVLCLAQRCAFNNNPFYCCLIRPGSASRSTLSKSKKSLKGLILAASELKKFRMSNSFSDEQIGLVNHLTAKFVLTAIMTAVGTKRMDNLNWVITTLKDNGHRNLETSGLFETKKYATIYNSSAWLFAIYYVFYTRLLRIQKWIKRRS